MLEALLRPLRRLRGVSARWSARDDRAFHDDLFRDQPYDPFCESFAGYVTIRRFAALAAPYIRDGFHVLDLGCGPGEITCALAALLPHASFHGVDHSEEAVRRAIRNAESAGLSNVSFECGDVTTFRPQQPADLVTMFDAFHHMVDPSAFVRQCSEYSPRFFLIEPAGDALGRWRRTLDFDWLPAELDKVRHRIEYELGVPAGDVGVQGRSSREMIGRAVEHRHPLSDFETFFTGFHLELRGTVAGFDAYPPDPHRDSAWRRRTMNTVLTWIEAVDDHLVSTGMDLAAKHWAIFATRDRSELRIARPAAAHRPPVAGAREDLAIAGPYDAVCTVDAPNESLAAAVTVLLTVEVTNRSWREWAPDGPCAIHLSYHWLRPDRRPVEFDGLRTPIGGVLPPGQSRTIALSVRTPSTPGRYLLEVDLVEEGVTWFSQAGTPPARVAVAVVG